MYIGTHYTRVLVAVVSRTYRHLELLRLLCFLYSLPSIGPNPGVQAVSLKVTLSHPPGGMLPLFSARPAVTSAAFTRWRHMVAYIRFQLTTH